MPTTANTNQTTERSRPRRRSLGQHPAAWLLRAAAVLMVAGCSQQPQQVVVYTALDEDFSKPLFAAFTRETGIEVLPKYDTESTKTVGLAEAIRAERARPRCDLFWNNEALHTERLAGEGLLRAYASPRAGEYPADARSPEGEWYGFAARARVLIVNTNLVAEARRPRSIQDLTDVQWSDRVGIAKPLYGTTATHAACLFSVWGEERAQDYFRRIKRNARIMSGNKQVARAVAAGELFFGLTDTDDAIIEVEAGRPVAIIYPDQLPIEGAGQPAASQPSTSQPGTGQPGTGEPAAGLPSGQPLGTLFIPNTLALVAGSPNQEAANRLVDFLLAPEVEARLAMGPSAQIPLNTNSAEKPRVETPQTVTAMQVDFAEAAESWEAARRFLTSEFTAAQ